LPVFRAKSSPERDHLFPSFSLPYSTMQRREVSVHAPFDILKKKPEGSFCRFEAVNDLASANIRIKELVALSLGEYVVFDELTHNVIAVGRSSFWVDARRE
jgi:hypothetical protein